MLLTTLFSLPVDVNVADVCLEQETLTLVLKSSQTSAVCPECSHASTRIRGRYTRTLADLPCQGRAVRVRLEVRRFVCRTRGCPRTTFAERFPQLSRAYARRTLRQAEALTEVAFANGGKAGAQLAKRLAMPTSRDTLLRLIRSTALPQHKTPQVLGLDDFAWKKGDRYGTLLVDLQAHCPVEVLPDREADTVVGWLRAHRGVKIISRDRAGTYAEAATRGAPRARQVADRYHVLVNLRDTLKDALARHQGALPVLEGALTSSQRSTELPEVSTAPVEASQQHERAEGLQDHGARTAEPHTLTAAERRRQISRTNRFARYEQIVTLHREGRERARDREASARQPQGGPSLGASWNLSGARAHWEASEQTRSLLARAFASAGKRAVTTASNSRVNSRPKDFADPPRWSVASLATGEHACLDHRSECAARNGRPTSAH